MSDWATPSIIIGGITAISSGMAALFSYLSWRGLRPSLRPELNANIAPVPGRPQWFKCTIELRNHLPTRWRTLSAELRAPSGVAGISEASALMDDGYGLVFDPEKLTPDAGSSKILLASELAPAGTRRPASGAGWADVVHETIYVRSPSSSRAATLSMRIVISSMERVERRITIDIKRTLPASVATMIE